MKILLLLTDLYDAIGGIQTFNRSFVGAIDDIAVDNSIEIVINAFNDCNGNLGFKSDQIKYKGFKRNKLSFLLESIYEARNANIVILGHVNFILVLLPLVNKSNVKKYLLIYGDDAWKRFDFIKRRIFNSLDKIISISKYSANRMAELNRLPAEKFYIFPCTLETDFIINSKKNMLKHELPLPKGKIILTVSRLGKGDKHKNIELVIKAMPSILKEVPDAYYVVIGDGNDRERLQLLASELGVEKNVKFFGGVSLNILPSYYDSCDVFVLPGVGEGFGIVFLEAMYHGKPCIGARYGGVPEVIEEGKTGFLCEPNDIESLKNKILYLLMNKSVCETFGMNGKKRFESLFSFDNFKNRLEEILCVQEK